MMESPGSKPGLTLMVLTAPSKTRIQGENNNFRVISVAYDERGKLFLTTWPTFASSAAFDQTRQPMTAVWTGFDAARRVGHQPIGDRHVQFHWCVQWQERLGRRHWFAAGRHDMELCQRFRSLVDYLYRRGWQSPPLPSGCFWAHQPDSGSGRHQQLYHDAEI